MSNDETTARNMEPALPKHLLALARVASYKAIQKWPYLKYYADEVESESLVAAVKAFKYYPYVSLLFSWGIFYATNLIIEEMRRCGWLPSHCRITAKSWSTQADVFEERYGTYTPKYQIPDAELKARLAKALKPREADIMWRRVVMDESAVSIGKSYNITRERVRQIVLKSQKRLRYSWAS